MVRCSQCQKELKLITGHATIRLYRCEGCGAQQMLPGDASAPVATAAAEPSSERIEDPIAAASALIASNPAPQGAKISPLVFALVAIGLGILLLVVVS